MPLDASQILALEARRLPSGLNAIVSGHTMRLEVTASAVGYLNAWLDGNDDGDWDDAGEHFANHESLVAGVNQLSFSVPPSAVVTPSTFARFRFSTAAGLSYCWAARIRSTKRIGKTLSGKPGDDAKQYQERAVKLAIEDSHT